MSLGAVWSLISRRLGAVLALVVLALGAVAALLAVAVLNQAQELAADPGQAPSSAAPSPTIVATSAQPTHDHSGEPSPVATPQPTAVETPIPTPAATPAPTARWTPAAMFSDDQGPIGVMDLVVWNGRFVAVGTTWVDGDPEPRLWQSADGRSWSQSEPNLGVGARVEVIAPAPDGRLVALGTIGGSVQYWSDPERAAAWATADGETWAQVELPFGAGGPGIYFQFAAGVAGFVATTGDDVWHSDDGSSWRQVYDAPRGTMVYEPVAGDEGWMVKRGNASLGTTTLLVSGDASTWHEVDLGFVAGVSAVGGDWLATRQTDDWERTEVLRSANGLDWTVILDLDDLTPPPGSDIDLASAGLVGATLTGTEDVLLMSPWRGGHCMSMPGGGWGAWWSGDGMVWVPAEIGGDAVVTHAAEIDGVTVLAGYLANTGDVTFWASAS